MPEENSYVEDTQTKVVRPNLIKSRQALLQNNNIRKPMQPPPSRKTVKPEQEETYANYESCKDAGEEDEENMYQNFQETIQQPSRNISRLHNQLQKTLATKKNAKEESIHRNNELLANKPIVSPKPETLLSKSSKMISDKKTPQNSFLYNPPKINQCFPKEMPS